MPRQLEPRNEKMLEFAFGHHEAMTPFVQLYEPGSGQIIKQIEFDFEYSDGQIVALRHRAVYEADAQIGATRVFVAFLYRWHESRHSNSFFGSFVFLLWLFFAGLALAVIVVLDEYIRYRVFVTPGQGSTHRSSPWSSPYVNRKSRVSSDTSPVSFSPIQGRSPTQSRKKKL